MPGEFDPDAAQKLPRRMDRQTAAILISHQFFPVSPRTLERWPLTWRRVNGRALVETVEILDEAQRRLDAATPIRGGKQVAL
jgi:hypothetical protein